MITPREIASTLTEPQLRQAELDLCNFLASIAGRMVMAEIDVKLEKLRADCHGLDLLSNPAAVEGYLRAQGGIEQLNNQKAGLGIGFNLFDSFRGARK